MTTSESEVVPTMTLSKAFDQVLLTPAEATVVLNTIAQNLRDIAPTIYEAFQSANATILEPPVTRSTSTTSTSSKAHARDD